MPNSFGGLHNVYIQNSFHFRSTEFTSHLCVDILYPNISECRCVRLAAEKCPATGLDVTLSLIVTMELSNTCLSRSSALSNICQSAWAFKHICDVSCRARDETFNFIFFSCMRMVKRVCLVCTDCGRHFEWVRPIIPATMTTHMLMNTRAHARHHNYHTISLLTRLHGCHWCIFVIVIYSLYQ